MAANYLPLLLAANVATPDDSSVTTLPTSQVDYLSHEWREEDVWSSWRSMTRQKNAIANGTRLENASWRTWWKQRNKLKTISPKTLNWLKDSDVTWLYGPLHPGVDWYPLAKSTSDANEMPCCSPSAGSPYTKPILKHRSISEILSLPPAPSLDGDDDTTVFTSKDVNFPRPTEPSEKTYSSRPPLLHTKSDTHITRHTLPQIFRKDSPPRIFSHPCHESSSSPDEITSNGTSTGSEQDLAPTGPQTGKKKHISFNTFVEQCIAIEKPKIKRSNNSAKPRFTVVECDDDGYDEDSEMGYDESEELPAPPSTTFYPPFEADSDSDSDDILEMTTSSSRSRSSSSSRSATPYYQPSRRSSSEQHPLLMGEEHRTIAYIAPTILKTTGVGNNVPIYGYEPGQALTGVELVYVPPIKVSPNGPKYGFVSGASTDGSAKTYPYTADGYFGSHGSGSQSSSSSGTSSKLPSARCSSTPSKPSQSSFKGDIAQERLNWDSDFSESIIHSEPIGIPLEMEENGIVGEDDAFDCFVGPDLGEDFPDKKARGPRFGRKGSVEDQRAVEVLKYAQGGAESVIGGRSCVSDEKDVKKPILVLVPKPHTEQITPSKPLYISPPLGVDVVHSAPFEHSPRATGQLLCPPDVPSTRGRMSPSSTPSLSGSTTSPSTSHSRSSDSRSESRGRSSTRNSSYSDRERSGSRSSRSTNSPLGSVSPSGSVIGICGQYSTRDGRIVGGSGGRERGRERTGRKLNGSVSSSPSSLSPPNAASPTRGGSRDYQPYHPTQSELYSSLSGSISDSISSYGSNSSTIGANSQNSSSESTVTGGGERVDERVHPIPSGLRNYKGISIPIPSPIPEEDEQRSRHPTPVSSPIMAMRPVLSIAPPHMSSPGITICTTPPTPEKSTVSAAPLPSRDYLDEPQVGTLVGRAVEIVSSALGSFWHTGSV